MLRFELKRQFLNARYLFSFFASILIFLALFLEVLVNVKLGKMRMSGFGFIASSPSIVLRLFLPFLMLLETVFALVGDYAFGTFRVYAFEGVSKLRIATAKGSVILLKAVLFLVVFLCLSTIFASAFGLNVYYVEDGRLGQAEIVSRVLSFFASSCALLLASTALAFLLTIVLKGRAFPVFCSYFFVAGGAVATSGRGGVTWDCLGVVSELFERYTLSPETWTSLHRGTLELVLFAIVFLAVAILVFMKTDISKDV